VWTAGAFIPAHAASSPPPGADHRKHIVVVDDDTLMLQVVERALSDYRVSTARDGSEAVALLSHTDPVHLLVTDYLMPVMTGQELVQHARRQRPGLAVLIVTGLAGAAAAADPEWWASERHLAKPFRLAALLEAVASLIG
jgi:hypothetical protein